MECMVADLALQDFGAWGQAADDARCHEGGWMWVCRPGRRHSRRSAARQCQSVRQRCAADVKCIQCPVAAVIKCSYVMPVCIEL